jgi:hypothetical protein
MLTLLKCLSRTEGQELMKYIHSGICGSHIGLRALLGNITPIFKDKSRCISYVCQDQVSHIYMMTQHIETNVTVFITYEMYLQKVTK